MQFKWLDDLAALADTRSFTRAAERRHVTQPAFGRRIRALEQWAGVPLIDRNAASLELTDAGAQLVDCVQPALVELADLRTHWHQRGADGPPLTVATGRTLARTMGADWIASLRRTLGDRPVRITTGSVFDVVRLLESGEAHFLLTYHHPSLALTLDARRFKYFSMGAESLVPVSRATPAGKPRYGLNDATPAPLLTYAPTLALSRLLADHLRNRQGAHRLRQWIQCDSADAMQEFARKGLGVAWLPWGLVADDCRRKLLAPLGTEEERVRFEVRLYRRRGRLPAGGEQAWAATVEPK
jgi:LysR family transcriptional regulator, hypochlorite-specific transcription factor HypT